MIGKSLRILAQVNYQIKSKLMIMKPSYFIGQGNQFHFYSFDEEIHKLKLAQDQLKNKYQQQHSSEEIVNYKSIDNGLIENSLNELNRLYHEGNMFNFQIDENYKIKNEITEFKQKINDKAYLQSIEQFKIIQALNIVEKVLNPNNQESAGQLENKQNYQETSLVLETFLHNILLSLLCEQQQLYKKMQQNEIKGPLIDEMYILTQFIQDFLSKMDENIKYVVGNPSLFKYIVKVFEILKIKPKDALPFIQKYLNETNDNIDYQNLHDISVLLLPISDYIFESGFQFVSRQQQNITQGIDLSNIYQKIHQILKESKDGQNKQNRVEVNIICKTLFCIVRIQGGRDKICLELAEALLSSNFDNLTEIEMANIIYSLIKIQYDKDSDILFDRKIKREMPNLVIDYETKIEKMLQTRYFHYARIPYILYCIQHSSKYRPTYRRSQINYICHSLMQIVMKNYEKYKASEITTIIYALKIINPSFQQEIETLYRSYFLKLALVQQKRFNLQQNQNKSKNQEIINEQEFNQKEGENQLQTHQNKPLLNPEDNQQIQSKQIVNQDQQTDQISNFNNILQQLNRNPLNTNMKNNLNNKFKNQGFNIKMQKVRNTIVYFEQLQAFDILCLFIGIRNNEKQQNNYKQSDKDSILFINQQIFQLFLSKQNTISNHLKIKILYEVIYNHQELIDSYLFESNFQDWIISVSDSLHTLNNHDFIALGYIMRKFVRLFAYHIDFWIKYCDESNKRTYNNNVENQRIRVVLQNMQDFYNKCLNNPPSNQKQEKNRIMRLQQVQDQLQKTLQKLNQINQNKEQLQYYDEFDLEGLGQYN